MEEAALKYRIMIKILVTLISRRKVSAKELADRYEICLRTVYRYIEDLSAAGIPIEVTRGRYGGISISDAYRLPAGYLSSEEYDSACNALRAWAAQVNDDAALSALEKIERQKKNDRRELTVTGNIIVDGGVWGDRGAFSDKMKACEKAVDECESIRIDYIARDGEHSSRVIDPHVLILKRNVWYVYAYCHSKGDWRTFKIGRIKKLNFTGKHFKKKSISKEDIPLDFFHSTEDMCDVTLEIERAALADAEEWLGVDSIEPRGNALVCDVTLPREGLANKILSFGGAIKVLSPAALADEVKSIARNIYAGQ